MGSIGKTEIQKIISEIDKNINFKFEIYLVGSVSSIIGYDLEKKTFDADTYNSLKNEVKEEWTKACIKLGIDLELTQTTVFTPPDGFENRYTLSDISTTKIKIYFMEKHDYAISKIARGVSKDYDDVLSLHRKSPLNLKNLINLFFEEYLFTVAIGSLTAQIINLKELIENLFGEDELKKVIPEIEKRAKK